MSDSCPCRIVGMSDPFDVAQGQREIAEGPLGSAATARHGRTFPVMTVVDWVLLAVSVAAFGYLGVAMFKPEWF